MNPHYNPMSQNGTAAAGSSMSARNPAFSGAMGPNSIQYSSSPLHQALFKTASGVLGSAVGVDLDKMPQPAPVGSSAFELAVQRDNYRAQAATIPSLRQNNPSAAALGKISKNSVFGQYALPSLISGGDPGSAYAMAGSLINPSKYTSGSGGDYGATAIANRRSGLAANMVNSAQEAVKTEGSTSFYKSGVSSGRNLAGTVNDVLAASDAFGGEATETANLMMKGKDEQTGEEKEKIKKGVKDATSAISALTDLFGPGMPIADMAKAIKDMTGKSKMTLTEVKKEAVKMQAAGLASGVNNESMVRLNEVNTEIDKSLGGALQGTTGDVSKFAMMAGAASVQKKKEESAKKGVVYDGETEVESSIQISKALANVANSEDSRRTSAMTEAAWNSKTITKADKDKMADLASKGKYGEAEALFNKVASPDDMSTFGQTVVDGSELNMKDLGDLTGKKFDEESTLGSLLDNAAASYAQTSLDPESNTKGKQDIIRKSLANLTSTTTKSDFTKILKENGLDSKEAQSVASTAYKKQDKEVLANVTAAAGVLNSKKERNEVEKAAKGFEVQIEKEQEGEHKHTDETITERISTSVVDSLASAPSGEKFDDFYGRLKKEAKGAINDKDKTKFQAQYEKQRYGDKIMESSEKEIDKQKQDEKTNLGKAQKDLFSLSTVNDDGSWTSKDTTENGKKAYNKALAEVEKEKIAIVGKEYDKLNEGEKKDSPLIKAAIESKKKGIDGFVKESEDKKGDVGGQAGLEKAMQTSVESGIRAEQVKNGESTSKGITVDTSTAMPGIGESAGAVEGGIDGIMKTLLIVVESILSALLKMFPEVGKTLDAKGP